MKINLNEIADEVTRVEGLKKQISVAQVKEVLRIVFKYYTLEKIVAMWMKWSKR